MQQFKQFWTGMTYRSVLRTEDCATRNTTCSTSRNHRCCYYAFVFEPSSLILSVGERTRDCTLRARHSNKGTLITLLRTPRRYYHGVENIPEKTDTRRFSEKND